MLTRFSPVEMRVRLPCLPLGVPKVRAPIVKRKSCLASNKAIQVQLLVGVLEEGIGELGIRDWKTQGIHRTPIPNPLPLIPICGVRGVAVAARLAVNQRVGVRLSSDTPETKE